MSMTDYERITRALEFLENHVHTQPRLAEVAKAVHLSEFHFQRLFRRWAGISPKRFLQLLTVESARKCLDESKSQLHTSQKVGLSSPGRLYDLFIATEATTPGQYKRKGSGLTIRHGIHESPFGNCVIGITEHGICALGFESDQTDEHPLDMIRRKWPQAVLEEDPETTAAVVNRIFSEEHTADEKPLTLHLEGTNFQIMVWKALLEIPEGAIVSYEQIAQRIEKPKAIRAVGTAVGQNAISWLIPCHRVIRKMGVMNHYRWGSRRKKAMLGRELAGNEPSENSADHDPTDEIQEPS